MKRSGRVPWSEVRVGLVILFAFSVLMYAAFKGSGMTVLEHTRSLDAYFDDVSGLAIGSPVWLGGIEVGRVSAIQFAQRDGVSKIRVAFKIKNDAWPLVSDSSRAAVTTMGLMGDKYLAVSMRQAGQPPATPGHTLPTSVSGDMTTAFADAPELMTNLSETIGHLNAVLARVERGEGFLGRLTTEGRSSDQIDSVVSASRQLLADLSDAQRRLVGAMETATASFDSLSDGILHGGGTLSRLVWDSSLYVELADVARRANTLVGRIDSGEGTLGKLAVDSTVYVDVRDLVADTRALVDDIMANPKKYLKISVF